MAKEDKWITKRQIEIVGRRPHHGITTPLAALKTANSSGIGEFYDLLPLIDWCSEIGFDMIQLLPIFDSGKESSPYNAVSSIALNPIYLSLHALPFLDEDPDLKKTLTSFNKYKDLTRIPYTRILADKFAFLRQYFIAHYARIEATHEYKKYIDENKWLRPYALFKVLKERYSHADWQSWPGELRDPTDRVLKERYEQEKISMSFYIFLQYLCYLQLTTVKKHAGEKNILFKGDIPILISPQSVDVWVYRADFISNYSVGAPPDEFMKHGQDWGFYLYNWEAIKASGYKRWKSSLQYAEHFYDVYRLDHIIGFFRFWAVEKGQKAEEGHYIPLDFADASVQGREILKEIIHFTHMYPIGEDLGAHVLEIRAILEELGISGTRLMRWMRNYLTDRTFIPYDKYHDLSMTTVSTHDSETLAEWWQNNPEEAKEFSQFREIEYKPTLTKDIRKTILRDSHWTNSFFHNNLIGEYLAMFDNMVWTRMEDERINVPGTVNDHNWNYRIRPSMETILAHKELKEFMQSLLSETEY